MGGGSSTHGHTPAPMSAISTKMRCSFKHFTVVLCVFNVVAILFVLQALLSPLFGHSPGRVSHKSQDSNWRDIPPEQVKYIKEAEEIRRAMEPVDLIKRVKQIQLESESELQNTGRKEMSRQKQATELSKRLNDSRASGDTQKAIEEWRKRKLERAKKREPANLGANA